MPTDMVRCPVCGFTAWRDEVEDHQARTGHLGDPLPAVVAVTRHPVLVRVMIEDGVLPPSVPVIEHATVEDVRGRHVLGVLPLALAAEAAQVTVPDLRVPPELRGVELNEEQVRKYLHGFRTFVVREITLR